MRGVICRTVSVAVFLGYDVLLASGLGRLQRPLVSVAVFLGYDVLRGCIPCTPPPRKVSVAVFLGYDVLQKFGEIFLVTAWFQ